MKNIVLIKLNKRDEVIHHILDLKNARLEQHHQEKLEEKLSLSKKLFTGYFVKLAKKFFSLTKGDLQKMTLEELMIIDDEIARKAYPRMILQALSCISLVPLLTHLSFIRYYGTRHCGTIFVSWHYLYHRKILVGEYGDKYFPKENLIRGDFLAGFKIG